MRSFHVIQVVLEFNAREHVIFMVLKRQLPTKLPSQFDPIFRFLLPELAPKKLLENNTLLVHSVVNDA